MNPETRVIRCAIYTRKSSEEGLEQSFNSLDAQREACGSFIKSQRHEGWQLLSEQYDDGGYSGGTMDRPGLKSLLEDSRKGRYAAAETLYQCALMLAEKTLGRLHRVTAEVLECYADLLAKTDRQSESTAMKRRAKAVWEACAPRLCRSYKDVQPHCMCGPEREGAD